jgi:hypothetical protein
MSQKGKRNQIRVTRKIYTGTWVTFDQDQQEEDICHENNSQAHEVLCIVLARE